jgi:hypothetical protein
LKLTVTTAGGGVLDFNAVLAVNIDEWTHLAVGYEGETHQAAFYLDGVRVPHTAPLEIPEVREKENYYILIIIFQLLSSKIILLLLNLLFILYSIIFAVFSRWITLARSCFLHGSLQ